MINTQLMWNEKDYSKFEKHMHETYPKMFQNAYGGFAVGAGWWSIVESLCHNIQSHVDWLEQISAQYPDKYKSCPQVTVDQIKEKFGGLRFYYSGGDQVVDGMVRMAESWANKTCEVCGDPGVRRSGGWIRTLCDKHEQERKEAMDK